MTAPSSRPSSRHAARVSALVAIALSAFAPIAVSAAGAPSGSTPRGAVGDALRSWIDANGDVGVELEGVYLGERDGVAAAYRAGGATRGDVGVFAASGGLDAGEAYVSVPWSLVLSAETDADWADVAFHLADGAAAAPGEPSAAALRATLVALQRDGDLKLAGAPCMSLELRVANDGAAPPPPPPAEASAAEQQLTTLASALAGLSAFLLFALAAAAALLANWNRTLERLLAPVPPPFEAVCAD